MPGTALPPQRVALVTGAAGGIGGVIARALAEDGIVVAGLDLSAAGIVTDVADERACRDAVERVLAEHGRLDILVNCAGITGGVHRRFWEHDLAEWRRVQAVNHVGAFQLAWLAVRPMLAQGWGRIINISTSLSTMLAPGLSAYGPSKAAMEASAAIWAKELAGTGVTANVLLPGGPVATDFVPADVPREHLLDAAIMGPPACWLASDVSAATTGMRLIASQWDPGLPLGCTAPAGWAMD